MVYLCLDEKKDIMQLYIVNKTNIRNEVPRFLYNYSRFKRKVQIIAKPVKINTNVILIPEMAKAGFAFTHI